VISQSLNRDEARTLVAKPEHRRFAQSLLKAVLGLYRAQRTKIFRALTMHDLYFAGIERGRTKEERQGEAEDIFFHLGKNSLLPYSKNNEGHEFNDDSTLRLFLYKEKLRQLQIILVKKTKSKVAVYSEG